MLAANRDGFFPYTPATNLLQGLKVAIDMLNEEGLDAVFARHRARRRSDARRSRALGLRAAGRDPAAHSPVLTAVRVPDGVSADALRRTALERCNMSLGNGLGPLADRVFRIGHLGDFSEPATLGTLACIEASLARAGIPHRSGGVQAAIASMVGADAIADAALVA